MLKTDVLSTDLRKRIKTITRRDGYAVELLVFAVSTAVFQFSRLIVSLVVAQWIGPEEFGVWNALNLLLLYGIVVTVGVPNGMNRDVPIYRGQKDTSIVSGMLETSFWMVLLANLIAGILISVGSLWQTDTYQQSLLWMGSLFFAWQLYQYLQLTLKARSQFYKMSQQQFVFAVLFPLVVLPFAYVWRIPGFIMGQTIASILLCFIIFKMHPIKLAFSWEKDLLRKLISSGWPIMLAGLVYSLLTTVDRWIIGSMIGVEALGHYTLAILCLSVFSLFPSVISQQMYPRMAYRYGQTKQIASLAPLIQQQTLLSVLITWPILLVVYIALPVVIPIIMPNYIMGIEPAQYLLFGLSMIPLASGVANFLNTVGKQRYYLAVQVAMLLFNICLSTLLVTIGWELIGVAISAVITYISYALTLSIVGYYIYAKMQ